MTRCVAIDLAAQMDRPQRIGLVGSHGVGKLTLLAVLYREAVSGRLPGLRLVATDPKSAEYLGEQIARLERGGFESDAVAWPELFLQLHHQGSQFNLVLCDHAIATDSSTSSENAFFSDCDALLVCVDADVFQEGQTRWQAEQQSEQAVRAFLTNQPARPLALVITRSDRLTDPGDVAVFRAHFERWLRDGHHPQQPACPWQGVFAVRSRASQPGSGQTGTLIDEVAGLLGWLGHSLTAQDTARLERLWQLPGKHFHALDRATAAYSQRHREAANVRSYQHRLRAARWWSRCKQTIGTLGLLLALIGGLWLYDAWGASRLQSRLAQVGEDPLAQFAVWDSYQTWYPTRFLFRRHALAEQDEQVQVVRQRAWERRRQLRLEELQQQIAEARIAPDAAWQALLDYAHDYSIDPNDRELAFLRHQLATLRTATEQRSDTGVASKSAGEESVGSASPAAKSASIRPGNTPADSSPDLAGSPEDRLQREQRDYRVVYEAFQAKPGEIERLQTLGQAYLTAHPKGRRVKAVEQLLSWCDRVSQPGEYRVVLESGAFSKRAAAFFSLGLSLSVELEVGEERHGPSRIARGYNPVWNHEFARKVRWKVGDPIHLFVYDHALTGRRKVGDRRFDSDPLALRKLNGEVELTLGRLVFRTDFELPQLPAPE
jgi:hypothetical protein